MSADERLPEVEAGKGGERSLHLLSHGELAIQGRLVDASNATLFASLTLGELTAPCVYKPVAGERPLWDFPDGTLAGREYATYLVSEASGWHVVPPTVLRDGPAGPGMCQLWMDANPDAELVDIVPRPAVPPGWLGVLDAVDGDGVEVSLVHADDVRLRRMAVLDVVVNNADRKGGHVLHLPDGRVLGVDHGICFAVEDKLRTVLWGWAGSPLDAEEIGVLGGLRDALAGDLGETLRQHLQPAEVERTVERIDGLLTAGVLPSPGKSWPAIPWPPF